MVERFALAKNGVKPRSVTEQRKIHVGCAGWSIPKEHAERFPTDGSHLERYAQVFPCVEINSSFYHSHRPATYARWSALVPDDFRFSVKVPQEITHVHRLIDIDDLLDQFLDEIMPLGDKLGPVLIQLPPSLPYRAEKIEPSLCNFRRKFTGNLICEPRHRSWFDHPAEELLSHLQIARVVSDPAVVPIGVDPGGWPGLVYYRLHGSPHMYYSDYSRIYLEDIATRLAEVDPAVPVWCIFDNTAAGFATSNAIELQHMLPSSR